MSKEKKVLISFVGSNDAGKLLNNKDFDGAIITALPNESLSNLFEISAEGGSGARFYGIKANAEKIRILKEKSKK